MKTLLILIFVVLFIYLIIHLCGGLGKGGKSIHSDTGFEKGILILDELLSLNDRDLARLKDDLHNIRDLLDKGKRKASTARRIGRVQQPLQGARSGKQILERIAVEMKRMETQWHRGAGASFSIARIILIQVVLILITILVVLL